MSRSPSTRVFSNSAIKKFWLTALKLLVSVIILILVISRADLSKIIEVWKHVHQSNLLLALFLSLMAWVVAAAKWQRLLPPENNLSLVKSLKYTMISLVYTFLLPGGQLTGEAGKFFHSQKDQPQNKIAIAGSIIADKLLSLSALGTVGLLAVTREMPTVPSPLFYFLGLLTLVGGIYLFLLLPTGQTFTNAILSRLSPSKKILKLRNLVQPRYFKAKNIIFSLGLSLGYHLLIIATLYNLLLAIDLSLSLTAVAWITAAASIFQAIPISVGGLGLREVSFTYLLSLYGINNSEALAFSSLIYLPLLTAAAIGAVFMLFDFFYRSGRSSSAALPTKSN